MSRKKKHEEHVNHERWLVSYADFITLLFAFFVVLFSSSQVDRSKTKKMALAIEAAFSSFSIFSQSGGQMNIAGSQSKAGGPKQDFIENEEGSPIFMAPQIVESEENRVLEFKGNPALDQHIGIPTPEEKALSYVQKDIFTLLSKKKFFGSTVVTYTDLGIVISIRESGMFESGSEALTPLGYELIRGIGDILTYIPNQVRVVGHTDDQAVQGKFRSNWELSTARATHVVEWLVDHYSMDPARFAVMGYGQYQPIAGNDTKEGREKNRRVEVILLSQQDSHPPLEQPKKLEAQAAPSSEASMDDEEDFFKDERDPIKLLDLFND